MWGNMMGWSGGYDGGWPLSHGTHQPSEDRSLTILRERYARGEIDKTEFDARRRDLA